MLPLNVRFIRVVYCSGKLLYIEITHVFIAIAFILSVGKSSIYRKIRRMTRKKVSLIAEENMAKFGEGAFTE